MLPSMPLTQRDIDELRAIHEKETGEKLTSDEAWEMGNRLLRLMDVLTRPDSARTDMLRSSSPVQLDGQSPGS
jgi:hypothetical protein